MGHEGVQPGIGREQLKRARKALTPLLKRFAEELRTSGKDIAVDFLCNGLQAIPVPLLNVALANAARRMLKDSPGSPAVDPQELLAILEEMQRSDETFERGLQLLSIDLTKIAADVRDLKQILTDQLEPRLRLISVEIEERWPISKNRVSGLLANAGGGSVIVNELFVRVESWEPELRVNYSVPAAPLMELHLEAELSTSQAEYPLFQLNGASARIYNERGADAERVVIELSSPENVRYALRLEARFLEVVTETEGSLLWPAADEPPLVLPFVCGPGWQDIDVSKLHAVDEIYRDMSETFAGLAALSARYPADVFDPELEAGLEQIRVPRVRRPPPTEFRRIPAALRAALRADRARRRPAARALRHRRATRRRATGEHRGRRGCAHRLDRFARTRDTRPARRGRIRLRLADPAVRAELGTQLTRTS